MQSRSSSDSRCDSGFQNTLWSRILLAGRPDSPESRQALEPDKLFDRRWALAVLKQTMLRLEAEYDRSGMKDLFTALQPFLTGDESGGYAGLAARLHRNEGSTRVLVSRFRQRFRHLIRAVIAETVADLEQVEIELQDLQAALRGK